MLETGLISVCFPEETLQTDLRTKTKLHKHTQHQLLLDCKGVILLWPKQSLVVGSIVYWCRCALCSCVLCVSSTHACFILYTWRIRSLPRYLLQSVYADHFWVLKCIYFLNTFVDVMNLVAVCKKVIEGKQIVQSFFFVWRELMNAIFYKLLKIIYTVVMYYCHFCICETAFEDYCFCWVLCLGHSVNGNTGILGLLTVPVMPQTKLPPCPWYALICSFTILTHLTPVLDFFYHCCCCLAVCSFVR